MSLPNQWVRIRDFWQRANTMPTDISYGTEIDDGEVAIAPIAVALEAKDAVLVAAAKKGSLPAFEVLVQRHERRMLRLAQRVTRNREDSQDVVQRSFQKAFVHLHRFEERASFSTWMTRIVVNEASMCLRANRRVRVVGIDELAPHEEPAVGFQIPDSHPSPEQNYSWQETETMLSFAIRQLSPGIRTAIKLCYLDERPLKETAQMMGISASAVKSRVLRGRRKLHKTLKRFLRPARTFACDSFETSAHGNAGSPWSAVRWAAAKPNGGGHDDNSSGSGAHHLSLAVPRSGRWKRIEPF
jgi:RNA polymerase sigma-70 factor, ECF subfamily